jgi:molybdate transport system substrate-binding protein
LGASTPSARGIQHTNKKLSIYLLFLVALLAFLPLSRPCQAATLRIAVASNFSRPLSVIAKNFEASTGHAVLTSPASTGKLFAQIEHGAPYDLFFAADAARPAALEEHGLALERRTYVYGKLVLWSAYSGLVDNSSAVLSAGEFEHLAIANPKTSPYGAAAVEVLRGLGLLERLAPRVVWGENIGQAHHFVVSGNAELGFIAQSQLASHGTGSWWEIPESAHPPIEQQLVRLTDNEAGLAFLAYLERPAVRAKLAEFGYRLPAQ